MARRRGYVGGTAKAFGVDVPQGSSGGLLMLLVGAYLLLAFVTGRLGWLTDTISDVFAAKDRYSATPTTAEPGPTTGPLPAFTAAYPNYARPRTYPVYA